MTVASGGRHVLIEASGIDPKLLDDKDAIQVILESAAREAKCTVLNSYFHQFSPQGVSGVVVIAESHLSVHTWPEDGYAALDVFTCGETALPRVALDYIVKGFKPEYHQAQWITRGPAKEHLLGLNRRIYGHEETVTRQTGTCA